jgi:hypothetical protein
MDFGHVADLAAPDDFCALARAFVRVALVAHLSGDAVLVGRGHQFAGFPDGAHQRLLDVDVLLALHAPHRRHAVHVVGRGDDDGVDVVGFLVQHLAEVAVFRRVGEALVGGGRAAVVDVAQGDDILGRRRSAQICRALAARADGGEVQFLIGRLVAQCFQ